MERDDYLQGIRSAWMGELFGEVFFKAMAERADSDTMRAKWKTLAQLEHVTGIRMAELLQSHGVEAVTNEVIEVGDDVLNRYTSTSHRDSMLHMKEVVEKAIIHFDQLLAVAPESDVPAVQFLVAHEQALLDFVEQEIDGATGSSTSAAEALLAQAS